MKRCMIMTFDKDGDFYRYKDNIGFETSREIGQAAEREGRTAITIPQERAVAMQFELMKMKEAGTATYDNVMSFVRGGGKP